MFTRRMIRRAALSVAVLGCLSFQAHGADSFSAELGISDKTQRARVGIGASYLSDLYDNSSHQASIRFKFGNHLGVGFVFKNRLDIGLKVQHYSHGGVSIKEPNHGVNFALLRVSGPHDWKQENDSPRLQ